MYLHTMKEKSKIEFVSILQEEEFVNQIKKALVSDSEMIRLINEYPDQKESLRYAIEFIKYNLADRKEMDQCDYDRILKTIHDHANGKKKTLQRRRFINHILWKVAAIFIVFASTTYGVYQYYKKDSLTPIVQNDIAKSDEAVIILSDGSIHKLGIEDTYIEYNNNGDEVIVKDNHLSEEKLANKCKSEGIQENQIVVPFGHRLSIKLSDGTQVHLNAGSKLVFPAEFSGSTRNVYLKGEGYFEVEKNPAKPFIVKTNYIDIKVFGTIFNISAYNDDQTVSAVLVEGSVNVSYKNKVFGNSVYNLQPGQGCFYSVKNVKAEVKKVDIADYVLWKDGIYQFTDQSLKEIVERIKRYYNITVMIDNNELANTIISGKLVFTDESEDVINYLAKTLEGHYDKKDNSNYLLKE